MIDNPGGSIIHNQHMEVHSSLVGLPDFKSGVGR